MTVFRFAASLLLSPVLLLGACDPGDSSDLYDGYDAYVIEEGDHYSTTAFTIPSGQEESFATIFDDSAVYETEDSANQGDINKLWGFSDCSSHHHTHSARFGWRWYDDALEIHAYTYVDGTRISELVDVVDIDVSSDYGIEIDGDEYVFTLDGVAVTMERGCTGSGGLRYQLYPYFGGDETAPHDVTIYIQEY